MKKVLTLLFLAFIPISVNTGFNFWCKYDYSIINYDNNLYIRKYNTSHFKILSFPFNVKKKLSHISSHEEWSNNKNCQYNWFETLSEISFHNLNIYDKIMVIINWFILILWIPFFTVIFFYVLRKQHDIASFLAKVSKGNVVSFWLGFLTLALLSKFFEINTLIVFYLLHLGFITIWSLITITTIWLFFYKKDKKFIKIFKVNILYPLIYILLLIIIAIISL